MKSCDHRPPASSGNRAAYRRDGHPTSHRGTTMALDDHALDVLFRQAHTHSAFTAEPVGDDTLHRLYDLLKWGPTSANSCPARFVFVKSREAKERLRPALSPGNVDKTMAAPVTAIIAYDLEFYEKLPRLFPHTDARSWYAGKSAEHIRSNAFRGG